MANHTPASLLQEGLWGLRLVLAVMGDRALPRVNKQLYAREIEYAQRLHKNNVKAVRARINNRPPTVYSHLVNQSKKKQMQLGPRTPFRCRPSRLRLSAPPPSLQNGWPRLNGKTCTFSRRCEGSFLLSRPFGIHV